MAADTIFAALEELQGGRPWGSVLDAGTGGHSLRWVSSLPTERWTAVTAEARVAAALREELAGAIRPGDRLVTGDWRDPDLLRGEAFDLVLADYLLGAIDGFAPYWQDRLVPRLLPHFRGRLALVGQAPLPEEAPSPWGRAVLEVARLRDACLRLAGVRCYREYPLEWVQRHLEAAGLRVEASRTFPIRFGARFVGGQLDLAREVLGRVPDRDLAAALERAVADLRRRALDLLPRAAPFGEDWLVVASRAGEGGDLAGPPA